MVVNLEASYLVSNGEHERQKKVERIIKIKIICLFLNNFLFLYFILMFSFIRISPLTENGYFLTKNCSR